MSYLVLSEELRIDKDQAISLIQHCRISNGRILHDASDSQAICRFFTRLIEGCELPVRKTIAVSLRHTYGRITSQAVFARYPGMRENMLSIMSNLSKVVFPTKLEYGIIHALSLEGDVSSGSVDWQAQNQSVSALNDVHLFHTSEPIDLYIQTAEDTGIRSVGANARRMKLEDYTPFQSVHALWGIVRVFCIDDEIHYRLNGITDEDFKKMLDPYLFPSGHHAITADSIEDIQYNSPSYWMECVVQMQKELDFSPAEKRGWTAIKRSFKDVRSLADFEAAVHQGSLDASARYLETINLVSYDFAYKLLTYLSIKFKRRMA